MDDSLIALRRVPSFFNVQKPGDIAWVHGINNRENLKRVCASPSVMMIEGDVSYIPQTGEILMAHPPAGLTTQILKKWQEETAAKSKKEKFTLEEWLRTITESHKGAKLDFKDPQAVKPGLRAIERVTDGHDMPIFLNADVLKGPGGLSFLSSLFDAEEFVSLCNQLYPRTVVSLGWTTEYLEEGKYTRDHLEEMLALSKLCKGSVTLSIRACFLEKSYLDVKWFLENTDHTLTIWNNEKISKELWEWIIHTSGFERVFYDIDTNPTLPAR